MFSDNFERETLGMMWRPLSNGWRIREGELCGKGARNRGVWLRMRIPTNAKIAFYAHSTSSNGDLKAEFWGDGKSGASSKSYSNATGYLTIFGGWHNKLHVLARLDEHKRDRRVVKLIEGSQQPRTRPVTPGQPYHFEVERRDGHTLRWWVDGTLIHEFDDDAPLKGPGHEYFGFNDWAAQVCFDNLEITPLGEP